jgi:hypothetical protein
VAIIHKNDLARSGYTLDMKVGKKKSKSFYILGYLPTGTYHKNLMVWILFFLPSNFGEFGSFV